MKPYLGRTVCVFVILALAAVPAAAKKGQPLVVKSAAIQVEMIQSSNADVPAEFQVALYEQLVRQLAKQRAFPHVYRQGDRHSADDFERVILRCTVREFKAGSERKRKVTTFGGWTSVTVDCQFTKPDGALLLQREITGRVRFFGGNLRATYDFAKQAARVAKQNFSVRNSA